MSHHTDTEVEQLREALDALWGLLPATELHDLVTDRPDIIDLCHANHQAVAHQDRQPPKPAPEPDDDKITLQQLIDRHSAASVEINHLHGEITALAIIDREGDEAAVYSHTDLTGLTEAIGEAKLHIALADDDNQVMSVSFM